MENAKTQMKTHTMTISPEAKAAINAAAAARWAAHAATVNTELPTTTTPPQNGSENEETPMKSPMLHDATMDVVSVIETLREVVLKALVSTNRAVRDCLAAGQALGVVRGGYYAIESLRLEKGYRAFGRELTPGDGPVEAGQLFTCKLGTDIDFLGRAALEQARAHGPRRRLVGFAVSSPEPMLWGGELILRDGVVAGQVTSAAWGATTGACVGLAYLRAEDGRVIDAEWIDGGAYEVNVGGTRYPVTVSRKALYDPTNARIR